MLLSEEKEDDLCSFKSFSKYSYLGRGVNGIIYKLDDKRLKKPIIAKIVDMRDELSEKQMKNYKLCQSCGIPLKKDKMGGGTNIDGSKSILYCSYCYVHGRFQNIEIDTPKKM